LCYLDQFSSVVRPNPFVSISLQPLCGRQKSQLLWNQANPASFIKPPGVGYPRKTAPLESATYRLFFPDLFMIWLTLRAHSAPTAHFFSPLVTRHSPLSVPLCFHTLTNCFSRKSLVLTTIQIARGRGVSPVLIPPRESPFSIHYSPSTTHSHSFRTKLRLWSSLPRQSRTASTAMVTISKPAIAH